MANKEIKEENVVIGIDTAENPAKAEMDFVTGLLKAVDYKTDESNTKDIDVKDAHGNVFFTFKVRPISTKEVEMARKKATKYVKNPMNKRMPLIESEKDFDLSLFRSWLIYIATTEEDREKIWGNAQLTQKTGAAHPVDNIAAVFSAGKMTQITNIIMEISGFGDEDEEESNVEEIVKN